MRTLDDPVGFSGSVTLTVTCCPGAGSRGVIMRVATVSWEMSSSLDSPALFAAPGDGRSNHFTSLESGAKPRETPVNTCPGSSIPFALLPPGCRRVTRSVFSFRTSDVCNSGPDRRFFPERNTTRKRPDGKVTEGKVHPWFPDFPVRLKVQPARFTGRADLLNSSTHG